MAAKTQTVTISLEEYKSLLLANKDVTNTLESRIVDMVMLEIKANLKYTNEGRSWSSDYMGDNIELDSDCQIKNNFAKQILQLIKIIDIEEYMKVWNEAVNDTRKKSEMEMRIEQMREAKRIRNGDDE